MNRVKGPPPFEHLAYMRYISEDLHSQLRLVFAKLRVALGRNDASKADRNYGNILASIKVERERTANKSGSVSRGN